MSTTTYQNSLKGKLVTVEEDDSLRVYSAGEEKARTEEFINGPATVGTATGNVFIDGKQEFIEVIRAKSVFFAGIPLVSKIYLYNNAVKVVDNPLDAKTTNPAPTPTGTTTDDSDDDVSDKPGEGRVPVTADNGKVVYVRVDPPVIDEAPKTTPNKWLTYGLYAVIALGVITLITILVISLKKPKTPVAKPALSK